MKASKVGRNQENYVIFGIFAFDETFEFIDRTFLFSDRDISVVLQQRSHPRRVNGGNVLTKAIRKKVESTFPGFHLEFNSQDKERANCFKEAIKY